MVDRTKYVPRIVPVEKVGKKNVHGIVHELLALNKWKDLGTNEMSTKEMSAW